MATSMAISTERREWLPGIDLLVGVTLVSAVVAAYALLEGRIPQFTGTDGLRLTGEAVHGVLGWGAGPTSGILDTLWYGIRWLLLLLPALVVGLVLSIVLGIGGLLWTLLREGHLTPAVAGLIAGGLVQLVLRPLYRRLPVATMSLLTWGAGACIVTRLCSESEIMHAAEAAGLWAGGLILVSSLAVASVCQAAGFGAVIVKRGGAMPIPDRNLGHRNYFFSLGWRHLWQVLEWSLPSSRAAASTLARTGVKIARDMRLWSVASWPLGGMLILLASAVLVSAVAVTIAYALLHGVILATIAAVLGIVVFALRTAELVQMTANRAFYACVACHASPEVPDYECPSCHLRQAGLLPGVHGVLFRKCECGKLLPTSLLLGRGRLTAHCPTCDSVVLGGFGSLRNVHIPLVGAPGVGKTSWLCAAITEIQDSARINNTVCDLPQPRDRTWAAEVNAAMNEGRMPAKTLDTSEGAHVVRLGRTAPEMLLCVYDKAGECFKSQAGLALHEYLAYRDGIILLVDPLPFAWRSAATRC